MIYLTIICAIAMLYYFFCKEASQWFWLWQLLTIVTAAASVIIY